LDQSKRDGDVSLARRVRIEGVSGETVLTRLDREHGDVTTLASRLGVREWPDESQWASLRVADELTSQEIDSSEFDLPQPGAIFVEFPGRGFATTSRK
jgi:xylan 1,4-beta-xylosidase